MPAKECHDSGYKYGLVHAHANRFRRQLGEKHSDLAIRRDDEGLKPIE